MTEATISNADLLKPEVIRNEIVETVDQMQRVEMGDGSQYASAMSEFPVVNLDDPGESYYTYDGVTGRMRPTAFDAESPVGSIDLPDRREVTIESYKKKYNPNKGTETTLNSGQGVPFSVFSRAVSLLRAKIFLTREQIAWRGDEAVDGLIGQYGTSPHPEIEHVTQVGTGWNDATNAESYTDISDAAFDVVNNGFLGDGPVMPNLYVGPTTLRDLKQTEAMQNRLPSTRYQNVNNDALAQIVSDDVSNIIPVMVYTPREDDGGNYLDEEGNIVQDADDAATDNILEPFDPATGEIQRNAVLGRPGAGSAYFVWFLDRLLEREGSVPGQMSVDQNNGFFSQVWSTADPIGTYMAAKQEIGFHIERGSNFAVLQGV